MGILTADNVWAGVDVGRQLTWFAPELALIGTMLAIVAAPIVLGRGARTIGTVAAVGVLVTFIAVLRVAGLLSEHGGMPLSGLTPQPASGMLIADHISVFYQFLLIIFLGGVMVLWWLGSADQERDAPEFFILLLGSALGMMLMAATTNLLMMVVAIEMASLPSYAIVGFNKRDPKAAEASLKYMVFGAISAAVMIYGVSLLYGLTGSLDMSVAAPGIVDGLSGDNKIVTGLALMCVLAGIGFKISAVPFHFWCPDAFEGAKIEVTTWLSVASKAAGLVLLIRLVHAICAAVATPEGMGVIAPIAWAIGLVAIATCTWANIAAYHQTSVKRLLAYSSIAHAGYMLMATAILIHPDTLAGAHPATSALLAYIAIYVFMNLGAFGTVALVGWATGSDHIDAFTGLTRRAPWLAVAMTLCLVSLIGLPPLAGFIGKWWILVALGRQGSTLAWTLVVVAVVNTLLSLFYYMRVVVVMSLKDDGRPVVRAPVGGTVLVGLCSVMLVALFVFVAPLKDLTDRYATQAFNPVQMRRAGSGSAPGAKPVSLVGLADAAQPAITTGPAHAAMRATAVELEDAAELADVTETATAAEPAPAVEPSHAAEPATTAGTAHRAHAADAARRATAAGTADAAGSKR